MTFRSVVVEALSNLRATPIRALLLLVTIVACLSAPGYVAARFSSNAWRNEESAVRHGAYIYIVESRDAAPGGGRLGILGAECEQLAQLAAFTHAGTIAALENARIGAHPDGGIEALAATPGIFEMLSTGATEGYSAVGTVASRELGLRRGDTMTVDGYRSRVAMLPDIAGRTDYFARTVLVPALPQTIRGKCILEAGQKDVDYVDEVVQALAGPRDWQVSKFSDYSGYRAADVLATRSGLPLAGLCCAAFCVVLTLFLALRKGTVTAYFVSGASRVGVSSIFLCELYVLCAIAVPSALTATMVGARMDMRDARVGVVDLALVAGGLLALSLIVTHVLIGSPSKVFEMGRRAE
ncbi:hypothetical protein P0W64_06235 [Tsukamurella sp. 8F]|uniref:hypothetical protein n=1 Tax=unclassified Tsukamurella TaxID=2633480 RepID=UPI0023B91573|nr:MULTISPECIES: hypothetical protein [unclassified Tsukamurella]MDF0530051.1 hypothetical protein [Tsukamurella sp. 8J]MDF0586369.1 hypothetical protein [Tsukamurella sp. 8F]